MRNSNIAEDQKIAQSFVVGLLFDPEGTSVLLIRKRRPLWQVGRLNGIGGKVEAGESPLQAMIREALEEADVSGVAWQPVAVLEHSKWKVWFFAGFQSKPLRYRQMTDEELIVLPVASLADEPIIQNLKVMIPLALDRTGISKPVVFVDQSPV
jgi:8-oxo-dGTP diphosphatase